MISRDEALELIKQQNPEPHMVQHALASEAVMRELARQLGEDEELWGLTGLLHDVDFPHTKDAPEKHGAMAEDLLAGKLPGEAVRAIKAHNGECTGVMPDCRFDYALRAAETVTGMVNAAALVRPTGYDGMEAKSLKKKMKDKAFAANVNRDNIRECEKVGLSLDDFLGLSIRAMAAIQ
ncbi:HDIG domain-containing protein [Desulfovibrio sp. OttesenSCG-928-O18]|nr:HDIG domain-containing protein [Desulfovibrio sp. OttesenSCG-928-O18]